MITNMDAWLRTATPPPAKRLSNSRLARACTDSQSRFPKIPGVTLPTEANVAYRIDFGPDWQKGIITKTTARSSASRTPSSFRKSMPTATNSPASTSRKSPSPSPPTPVGIYATLLIGASTQRLPFEGSFFPFPKDAAARAKSTTRGKSNRRTLRQPRSLPLRNSPKPPTPSSSNVGSSPKTGRSHSTG